MYIIYGLGISGIATAKYLLQNNYKIIITDDNNLAIEGAQLKLANEILQHKNNVQFVKSNEIEKFCDKNTIIVFAPGIPLYYPKRHAILEIVKKTAAKLLCDVELFYLFNCEKSICSFFLT